MLAARVAPTDTGGSSMAGGAGTRGFVRTQVSTL